jgi:hypothetical protein
VGRRLLSDRTSPYSHVRFITEGFELTPWIQRADFTTSDGKTGAIEVVYRESRPDAAEGPFLAEEGHLIQSLAGMLRAYFERLGAEEHSA